MLAEMGVSHDEPTKIHVDNAGAVELARDRKACNRSRHVDRRHFKVRELEADGVIKVEKVSTNDNVADIFTKPLPFATFRKHLMKAMGLRA